MRFAEIALLALPFVVFVAWRLLAPATGAPPRVLVIAVMAAVITMAGLLLAFWREEAESPGTAYVPARVIDGQVVPGRVEPAPPGHAPPGQPVPSSPGQK